MNQKWSPPVGGAVQGGRPEALYGVPDCANTARDLAKHQKSCFFVGSAKHLLAELYEVALVCGARARRSIN